MIDRDGLYERGIFSMGMGWQIPRIPGLGEVDWGIVHGELYRAGYEGDCIIEHEDRRLRGDRREGQAGLPDRTRRPQAVYATDMTDALSHRDPHRARHREDDRPLACCGPSSMTRSSRTAAGWRPSTTSRPCASPGRRAARVGDPRGTDVAVGTVIGFPHGDHRPTTKVFEASRALGRRRDRARHGHPDRRAQVRPRRGRRGRHRGRRRRRPRGRRDRQGDLRERLPDRRREDPRVPPVRGRRRRLRQDVDGLRARRRHPRRPAPDARQHLAAHRRSRRPAASGRSTRCSRSWRSATTRIGATATKAIIDDFRARKAGRRRSRRAAAAAEGGC